MNKKYFRITLNCGMSLVHTETVDKAKKYAFKEFGEIMNPRNIQEANEDDVSWFKMMDGRIAEI